LLSAGEVVENPAAVVKELVENSIDAGATRIEIEIARGGLDKIRVSDNGCGVEESEVEKVFLPHATSKIKTEKDILKIGTMGFRGEAMASISAVSNIFFSTNSRRGGAGGNAPQATGVKLQIEAGKIIAKKPFSRQFGTETVVESLFFNTPARLKFLKSPASEKNSVTDTVARQILASTGVNWRYIVDGDIFFNVNSKTLLGAIAGVYGDFITKNILPIDANDGDIRLNGYVGDPTIARKNKSAQTVIINGRAVENGIIGACVNETFENYVMPGNFPFFVLRLDMDLSNVDVNIHPRKLQVKFSNADAICALVRKSVMAAMDKYLQQKHAIPEEQKSDDNFLKQMQMFSLPDNGDTIIMAKSADHIMNMYDRRENPEQKQTQMDTTSVAKFRVLGTVFNTYILVEDDKSFHIIDQHAAAERLAFDKLSKQIDEHRVEKQRLIEPEILTLTPEEMTKMDGAQKMLNDCGIECAPFGKSCYKITAVPLVVAKNGIDVLLDGLMSEVRVTKLSDILKNKIIMQCCKGSIKGGQILPEREIKDLVSALAKAKTTPTCPHGRPIIKSFSLQDLEKMFARK